MNLVNNGGTPKLQLTLNDGSVWAAAMTKTNNTWLPDQLMNNVLMSAEVLLDQLLNKSECPNEVAIDANTAAPIIGGTPSAQAPILATVY